MPGKHVRFADADIIHYLPTPALSISSLQSPSSSGLPSSSRTTTLPPPSRGVLLGPSPHTPIQPPLKPNCNAIQLHVLLQLSSSPVLNFDIRQPPSMITSHHWGIQLRALLEPATHPPLAALTIISSHVPWSLTVYPSHLSRDGAVVTVEDVLQQLYDMLRTGISAQEFHSLLSDKDRSRVSAAYGERYRRIRGPRESEDEKRCGVRRVDFFKGHTKFMGLSPSKTRQDVWLLHSA